MATQEHYVQEIENQNRELEYKLEAFYLYERENESLRERLSDLTVLFEQIKADHSHMIDSTKRDSFETRMQV